MTRYFLTGLTIEGFRGINNEGQAVSMTFAIDKVNSVFAANGIGKSSIFDALQFALSGRVARLGRLQSTEDPDNYISNLFHSKSKSTVELELTSDDAAPSVVKIRVVRGADGKRVVSSPSGYGNPRELLNNLNREYALLDYWTFQEFIQASALDRGRSFAPLLGLAEYSATRRCLQAACDKRVLNADLDVRAIEATATKEQARKREALQALVNLTEKLTGETPTDMSTVQEWPAKIVSALASVRLLNGSLIGCDLLDVDFDALRQLITDAEDGRSRQELARLIADRTALEALGSADEELIREEFDALCSDAVALESALADTRGHRTKNLLDCAHVVLESEEWQDDLLCPLCGSTLEVSLGETVRGAIEKYEQVDSVVKKIAERLQHGPWATRLAQLDKSELLEAIGGIHAGLTANLQRLELTVQHLTDANNKLLSLESMRTSKYDLLSEAIDALERDLPPSLVGLTAQVDRGQMAAKEYGALLRASSVADALSRKLEVYRGWIQFISHASASFGEAEATLARGVLDELKADYQQMFVKVMSVSDVIPNLERDDTGEHLDVTLEQFHGIKSISAKAVLSESYRNALAISVFLSAANKQRLSPRFIVLDDVTSSFDAGNQFQLMDYIRSKLQYPSAPDGLQFILLSHDVTLEKYFDRLSTNENDWKHQKLYGWPPYTPISVASQRSDRLKRQAENFVLAGQLEQASGVLRQYLEFVLIQIISHVQIPVPIDLAVKDHTKMVQACLDAIDYAVQIHDQIGTLVLDRQQVVGLTTQHLPAIVGNWVSHYGTSGSAMFSPPALLGIIQSIEALEHCFKHEVPPGSGKFQWYRSLTKR